jgi:hypothetical protein
MVKNVKSEGCEMRKVYGEWDTECIRVILIALAIFKDE